MTQRQLPLIDQPESQSERCRRILNLAAQMRLKLRRASDPALQFDPERVEAEHQRRGVGANLENALEKS